MRMCYYTGMSNNKYKIAAGAGLAFLILSRSWVQMVLGFFILMFVGHIIWQLSCEGKGPWKYGPPSFEIGIKSKSTALPRIPENVDELDRIDFKFNGYDIHVYKAVASWLVAGSLEDPATELGYLYGKRCKEGISFACESAWREDPLYMAGVATERDLRPYRESPDSGYKETQDIYAAALDWADSVDLTEVARQLYIKKPQHRSSINEYIKGCRRGDGHSCFMLKLIKQPD